MLKGLFKSSRRRRQAALVFGLCLSLNGAAWLLGELVLLPGFAERERVRAALHLKRIENFMAREGEHLRRLAAGVAVDIRRLEPFAPFGCIRPAALAELADVQKVDALVVYDGRGRVFLGCDDGLSARLVETLPLANLHSGGFVDRFGLHGVDDGVWLLAMVPVAFPSGGAGGVLLGRHLDANRLGTIADILEYDMQLGLAPVHAEERPAEGEVRLDRGSPEVLLAQTLIEDFDGVSRIKIVLRLGREAMAQGRLTVKAMQLWVGGLSVVFAGLAFFALGLLDRGAEKSVILRELMERSGEALLLVLPDGTISAANPRGRELLGIDSDGSGSAPKVDALLFGLGEDRHPADMAFPGESPRTVLELPLPSGGKATLEVDAVEVKLDGREHLLMQLRDVSLKKEAERLARLASLGELAAGVAHEINNPAGMIQRNLDFVSDVLTDALPLLAERADAARLTLGGVELDAVREQLPQLVDDMALGCRRIGEIVRDLKDFAREDSAAQESAFDLNEAVGAAVRLLNSTLRKATDHFSAELAADLPPTQGSLRQIEQVVLNLLQNACQALPDRSRSIRIVTSHDARAGVNRLRIIDAGEGIPEELLDRIMEPFFTTRRESGGTGLGLSVSSRIVRNHQGALEFASKRGHGTVVTLTLPAVKEQT